jgi:hypothetical protein
MTLNPLSSSACRCRRPDVMLRAAFEDAEPALACSVHRVDALERRERAEMAAALQRGLDAAFGAPGEPERPTLAEVVADGAEVRSLARQALGAESAPDPNALRSRSVADLRAFLEGDVHADALNAPPAAVPALRAFLEGDGSDAA